MKYTLYKNDYEFLIAPVGLARHYIERTAIIGVKINDSDIEYRRALAYKLLEYINACEEAKELAIKDIKV